MEVYHDMFPKKVNLSSSKLKKEKKNFSNLKQKKICINQAVHEFSFGNNNLFMHLILLLYKLLWSKSHSSKKMLNNDAKIA